MPGPSPFLTSLHDDSDTLHEQQKKVMSRLSITKNEAEIIEDFPMNQRPSSLPGVSASDRFAAAIIASGAKFNGQGQRRGSITDCSESFREIRSLHRNSLEEKRLQQAVCQLDRQSFAGVLEFRQKVKEVFKDYNKMIHRSPTADEWLLMKKSRSTTLQEKEKEDIARRYSRRERHFRAPPYLHEVVTKIRSHAMTEAGLLNEESGNSKEDNLEIQFESLNLSRRHTISGDNKYISPVLLSTNENFIKSRGYLGRRMTLGDTRILQDVLELKTDKLNRIYVNDFIKRKGIGHGSENNQGIDFCWSGSDGESDINSVMVDASKERNEGNVIHRDEYEKGKEDGDEKEGTNAFDKGVNAIDLGSSDKVPRNDNRYTA